MYKNDKIKVQIIKVTVHYNSRLSIRALTIIGVFVMALYHKHTSLKIRGYGDTAKEMLC